MDWLAVPEWLLRAGVFLAVLSAMAWLEIVRPRRRLRALRRRRWTTNLTIVGIDTLLVRVMAALPVPLAALATAVYAQAQGWGAFNWLGWRGTAVVVISLIVLDFAIWLQHMLSHRVAVLWRLHRVHHADIDIDVTTAIRFHPIEIALSMLWKMVWVLALGVPPAAVLVFEIVLNVCALFNHANVALPTVLDRVLRSILVTPDMHRVHHSVEPDEHHANYGFNLSIWDRLFGTYVGQPVAGHDGMTIGLRPYQSEAPTQLGWSLTLPWHRPVEGRNGTRGVTSQPSPPRSPV